MDDHEAYGPGSIEDPTVHEEFTEVAADVGDRGGVRGAEVDE